MNSVQKVYAALELLADMEDEEIREAIPVPIPPITLRGVLPAVGRHVPENEHELDQFLTDVGDFCHSLRSDGYEPAGR